VHFRPRMRSITSRAALAALAAVAALAGACGGGDAVVRGDVLAEGRGEGVRAVWVLGREGRSPIVEGGFELREVPPGVVDLRLGDADTEVARVLIRDVPSGARLSLQGIWIEPSSRLAFPSRIELEGARVVNINGIRMAPPDRLRGQIREDAVVLAVSGSADALLARPHDERLPDLQVVATPATETVTPDGDPGRLGLVAPGDSIRVEGTAREGYVIASRLVVPRGSVLRSESAPDPQPEVAPSPPREREPAVRREPPGQQRDERGRGRGRGRGRD
jgi:hypothetical protein